jgi:hypothetical protein
MRKVSQRTVVLAALGLAFFVLRAWNVTNTFWLYSEQIRDWNVAIGSWRDLPLVGAPSTAGGNSLGPIYYWVLWLSRVCLEPFLGRWPHVGGIAVALLQATGDACLLSAIWRRWSSWPLALAITLLVAGPFDLALSAIIWNPPVAVAFVKFTIALVLTQPPVLSAARIALTTATAWLAVQAHSTALFMAAAVIGALVVGPLMLSATADRWRAFGARLRLALEVILVLQLTWLWHQLHTPDRVIGPQTAIAHASSGSGGRHFVTSFTSVIANLQDNLAVPWAATGVAVAAALLLVVTVVVYRRDLPVLSISVAPVIAAVFAFSEWQRPYEAYWFLTLGPAMGVTVAATIGALPPRWASRAAWGLLVLILIAMPARFTRSQQTLRMPEYRALVKGTTFILHQTHELRQLRTTFKMPDHTDETYMFVLLGGRYTDRAPFTAVINASGDVTFERP